MNAHSWRVLGGLAAVFVTAAASAWVGGWSAVNVITMIIAGLVAVEHALNGNISPSN